MEDLRAELTGALIGLARATENNDHLLTPSTGRITVEALNATRPGENPDEAALHALLEEVNEEKRRLVPDCFYCAAPCGRTASYDLSRLALAEPDLGCLKNWLLFLLRDIGHRAFHEGHWQDALPRYLYLGLYAIGMEDWREEELMPIILEAGSISRGLSREPMAQPLPPLTPKMKELLTQALSLAPDAPPRQICTAILYK